MSALFGLTTTIEYVGNFYLCLDVLHFKSSIYIIKILKINKLQIGNEFAINIEGGNSIKNLYM